MFSTLRPLFPLSLLAVLTLGSNAHADQLADIQKKGEIVIGVLGTAEPYSFIDPGTRELVGYEVDLGKAIAAKLGVKPVFKQIAVAARIPELQQGHVDILAAALAKTPERAQKIQFSTPIFVSAQKVLVQADAPITALAQLDGKRVTTVKGGTQEANIKKAVPGVQVITFENAPQAFQALQQNKGVGYVDDETALADAQAKLGSGAARYRLLQDPVSLTEVAIAVRKQEGSLLQAVNQTLGELEAKGQAEQLFLRWYGPQTRHQYQVRSFRLSPSP